MKFAIFYTDVVSFLLKDHSLAVYYEPYMSDYAKAISFVTVGELFEGCFRANWGRRRFDELDAILNPYRIIPYTPDISRTWGWIRWKRKSQPIAMNDAWIAAT